MTLRRRRYQQREQTIRDLSDAELLEQYRSACESSRAPERDRAGQPLRGSRRNQELLRRRKALLLDQINRRGLDPYAATTPTTEENL